MEDRIFRYTSIQLLEVLRDSFLRGKTPGQVLSRDEQHFFEGLEDALSLVKKRKTIDNVFLMALEKCYKRTCILIGLTHFQFDDQTQQVWKNFRDFHEQHAVSRQRLFGFNIGM